jgi:hypothetical protein
MKTQTGAYVAPKRTSATTLLADWFRDVAILGRIPNPTPDRRRQVLAQRVQEGHRLGSFRVHGADGIDFNYLVSRMVTDAAHSHTSAGENLGRAFSVIGDRNYWDQGGRTFDRRVIEQTVSAIDDTGFGRYLGAVLRMGTLEMCSGPSMDDILGLVGEVQVDCTQRTMVSDPAMGDYQDIIGENARDEETPMLGMEGPTEVALPNRTKVKYAWALKRETMCGDLNQTLRRVIDQQALKPLRHYWGRHIIKALFDLYAAPEDNPWVYERDGYRYKPYYQVQPAASVPYENLIYNQTDFVAGNFTQFVALENLFEEARDPRTNEPIECCAVKRLVTTSREQRRILREALGMVEVQVATANPGNETMKLQRQAREGWDADGLYNIWIRDFMDQQLADIHTGWTKAQRREAMERTFVAGCTQQAIVKQVEWSVEVRDYNIDMLDFSEEIIWAQKVIEKAGLAWVHPEAVALMKGLPDGESVPSPDPSTVPLA